MASKKSILEQIKEKVARKKALSIEIAQRNSNVESFVLKMIDEIDQMVCSTVNTSLGPAIVDFYVKSMQERIKSLDSGAKVDVSWQETDNPGEMPRLTGVLIKWSTEYQTKNNCEAQLFIDPVSLLFK